MRVETMARFGGNVPEEKMIGTCEGCGDPILELDEHFDHDGDLVHKDSTCVMDYMANISELIA